MKSLSIIVAIVMTAAQGVVAQNHTEKITKELSFEKKGPNNALLVSNINGSVKAEGYEGDKILIEVTKTIQGKTQARLEKGIAEVQLGVIDRADTLILFVKGICSDFGKQPVTERGNWSRGRNERWNGWGYNWNDCNRGRGNCDTEYDYKMDFVIKVPAGVNLLLSTVNSGDVDVANVTRGVHAENINGSIRLKNISGATYASTINGDVDLNYSSNPPGDSRYYSLNGNINANFKKGLGAQLTFKSFNGDFYSSVDEITPMAVVVEKYSKAQGVQYKVNGNRYKVRQGGPLLDFETFNGDVYLKEN